MVGRQSRASWLLISSLFLSPLLLLPGAKNCVMNEIAGLLFRHQPAATRKELPMTVFGSAVPAHNRSSEKADGALRLRLGMAQKEDLFVLLATS